MDLFRRNLTETQQHELDALRSQINIARFTLLRRVDNDLSQAELAKLAGTTQARVSEIEALKGDPKLSTLARIAWALGCMIDMVPIAGASVGTMHGFRALASQDVRANAGGAPFDAVALNWRPGPSESLWEKIYG